MINGGSDTRKQYYLLLREWRAEVDGWEMEGKGGEGRGKDDA